MVTLRKGLWTFSLNLSSSTRGSLQSVVHSSALPITMVTNMSKTKNTLITLLATLFIASATFSTSVQAKILSTEQVQNQSDKVQLHEALARTEVQEKLLSMGVDPDQVKERIDHLSEQELAQLNERFDELPAGAGAVGTLVFIFVVFVITDMLGATDIFPFVNKIN